MTVRCLGGFPRAAAGTDQGQRAEQRGPDHGQPRSGALRSPGGHQARVSGLQAPHQRQVLLISEDFSLFNITADLGLHTATLRDEQRGHDPAKPISNMHAVTRRGTVC